MKLRRDISGRALAQVLCTSWNYRKLHQVGSHIILETDAPSHQRMVIPDHKQLRIGTLNNILRAVSRHKNVSKSAIAAAL